MPIRGLLTRSLLGLSLLAGALIAVIGGLALRASGMIAVCLAAVVIGCVGAGLARDAGRGRREIVEAAWQAAAATVGLLLLLSGTAVLGGAVAVVVVAGAVLGGWVAVWLRRTARTRADAPGASAFPPAPGPAEQLPASGHPAAGRPVPSGALFLPPVVTLSTEALAREWVGTTAALTGPLGPAVRQSIVRRRQEILDELERRDPAGVARWLAAGPAAGDPAGFLHGDPAAGTDAA
ncbi:MAG TPA: hypothetical protein VHF92_12880 [Geodermatophilus sp.]|nr:hypothetical protein [Geodermatophilus sp.]